MSNAILDQVSNNWSGFWLARSAQERKMLTLCAVVIALALAYLVLLAPAISGRAQEEKALPDLRLHVAEMQMLIGDVQKLGAQSAATPTPMTKESLEASLAQHGLTPVTVALTSDFAKVQATGVPFAGLLAWLDEQQKVNRIAVLEATVVAQPVAGMVTATLSLRQQRLDQ